MIGHGQLKRKPSDTLLEENVAIRHTLYCTSSAGNQLFTEALRSGLLRSEPSGAFLGLRLRVEWALSPRSMGGMDGGTDCFLLTSLGSNTGAIDRGGVQFKAGSRPLLFIGSQSELDEELGLELEFASLILMAGRRGDLFKSRKSIALPFPISSVVVVTDRFLFNGVPSLDSSESCVLELCKLRCSNCFLLHVFNIRKITMAAIRKQMTNVTATEMPIAADTLE